IRRWQEPFPRGDLAEVVIEAFGCGLPDRYVEQLMAMSSPPHWFVLEYLTAEPWVDAMHGLPSPHPRLPFTRRFWFPGFTPNTGGLLREHDLFVKRDAFQSDPSAQAAWWDSMRVGIAPP